MQCKLIVEASFLHMCGGTSQKLHVHKVLSLYAFLLAMIKFIFCMLPPNWFDICQSAFAAGVPGCSSTAEDGSSC